MERRDGPTMLVLTRQKLPVLERATIGNAEGVRRGAYVLQQESGKAPAAIIIATGSEVTVGVAAARLLEAEGVPTRVVSMPSWELFAAQPASYRDSVLPPSVRSRVAVEAAGPMGWSRWTTDEGAMVGMAGFGASAPGERLFEEFKLTPEQVAETVRGLRSRSSTRRTGEPSK
jgi:transketolase